MIAVLKETATEQQISNLVNWFESQGLKVNRSQGDFVTILGLIGDTTKIDIDLLRGLDIIDNVMRISEPFKKANRKFHPEDTVVDISGVKIGGGNFAVMAGPCSVENEEQIIETAKACIKAIRNIRAEADAPNGKKLHAAFAASGREAAFIEAAKGHIASLAGLEGPLVPHGSTATVIIRQVAATFGTAIMVLFVAMLEPLAASGAVGAAVPYQAAFGFSALMALFSMSLIVTKVK